MEVVENENEYINSEQNIFTQHYLQENTFSWYFTIAYSTEISQYDIIH